MLSFFAIILDAANRSQYWENCHCALLCACGKIRRREFSLSPLAMSCSWVASFPNITQLKRLKYAARQDSWLLVTLQYFFNWKIGVIIEKTVIVHYFAPAEKLGGESSHCPLWPCLVQKSRHSLFSSPTLEDLPLLSYYQQQCWRWLHQYIP